MSPLQEEYPDNAEDGRTCSPAARLFPTKNDLPAETRAKVAGLLNLRLADCIDLQTQCKQAHWNVKGPQFIGLQGTQGGNGRR